MNLLLVLGFFLFQRSEAAYDIVCHGDLGCFTDGPPYGDTDQRPIGHLPTDPEKINVRFYLDTRSETNREVFNDNMADFETRMFDPTKETKFIIHGFLHNGEAVWMHDMADSLLSVGDYNVIRVGWFGGSVTLQYPQAAVDTQIVGAEVGLFIRNIMSHFEIGSEGFHCIGHSLGGQSCGYAGAYVQANAGAKIGRISGLDPAGPYFEGTEEEVRLDPSDAEFVDVIHTDAEKLIDLGFGTNQVSGHIDFWPNNGLDQPGCDQNALSTVVGMEGIKAGVQDFFACSHLRAVSFYIDSIINTCSYTAVACSNYDDFLSGKCLNCPNGVCTVMGFHTIDTKDSILQSSTPNYYLQTGPFRPFCEYPFYVEVTLGNVGDSVDGKLYLSLYSMQSNSDQQLLQDENEKLQLRPSTTFSYFAYFRFFPSGLNKVKLLWTQEEWTIGSKHISVQQIDVTSLSEQKQYSFCGDPGQKLNDGVRHLFRFC